MAPAPENKAFKLTSSGLWRHFVPPQRMTSQLNAMFDGRVSGPMGRRAGRRVSL